MFKRNFAYLSLLVVSASLQVYSKIDFNSMGQDADFGHHQSAYLPAFGAGFMGRESISQQIESMTSSVNQWNTKIEELEKKLADAKNKNAPIEITGPLEKDLKGYQESKDAIFSRMRAMAPSNTIWGALLHSIAGKDAYAINRDQLNIRQAADAIVLRMIVPVGKEIEKSGQVLAEGTLQQIGHYAKKFLALIGLRSGVEEKDLRLIQDKVEAINRFILELQKSGDSSLSALRSLNVRRSALDAFEEEGAGNVVLNNQATFLVKEHLSLELNELKLFIVEARTKLGRHNNRQARRAFNNMLKRCGWIEKIVSQAESVNDLIKDGVSKEISLVCQSISTKEIDLALGRNPARNEKRYSSGGFGTGDWGKASMF